MSQSSKKKPTVYSDSILESLRDLSGSVGNTLANDVAGKVANDALASIFGTPTDHARQANNEGIRKEEPTKEQPRYSPHHQETSHIVRSEEADLHKKVEAVRQELKALAISLASLNSEVKKAIAEVPVQPGIYHLTFLERLKNFLVTLRQQVDDSRTWLSMYSQRKQKKGYWGMYKKHGTNFGLSNERVLATQAG